MAIVYTRCGKEFQVTAERLQEILQIKEIRKQIKTYKFL